MTLRCPTCRQPAGERKVNRYFPFCSERCRLLDLGSWFEGRYRVPGQPAGGVEDDPGAGDGEPPEGS
jgi:endogenous inhibitor of DNA gyrase (YacG/DUF329 family)